MICRLLLQSDNDPTRCVALSDKMSNNEIHVKKSFHYQLGKHTVI